MPLKFCDRPTPVRPLVAVARLPSVRPSPGGHPFLGAALIEMARPMRPASLGSRIVVAPRPDILTQRRESISYPLTCAVCLPTAPCTAFCPLRPSEPRNGLNTSPAPFMRLDQSQTPRPELAVRPVASRRVPSAFGYRTAASVTVLRHLRRLKQLSVFSLRPSSLPVATYSASGGTALAYFRIALYWTCVFS